MGKFANFLGPHFSIYNQTWLLLYWASGVKTSVHSDRARVPPCLLGVCVGQTTGAEGGQRLEAVVGGSAADAGTPVGTSGLEEAEEGPSYLLGN